MRRTVLVFAVFEAMSCFLYAQKTNADRVVASSNVAIVPTESGKVQGFLHTGTYTFRGVPYAQAERFMPPEKVPAWRGVRRAITYGNICPQPISSKIQDIQVFFTGNRFWPADENCQNLNIWTPGIQDGKKRPVMVWLHGGGYFSGSSIEMSAYDGDHLSKKGDVVVVTVNHRLNVLGFLDLSAYGEKYKYSGNAGMLDLVAALQWVKANIENFGGDPSNVTIWGQSGGGGKVATLLSMPAAHGLFEKAIIESGGANLTDQTTSRKIAELTLQNAGLNKSQIDQLQKIPYDKLVEVSDKALKATGERSGVRGSFGTGIMWTPVADGDSIPHQPFSSEAPPESANIPLLIGSTLNEFGALNPLTQGSQAWGMEEVRAYFVKQYGTKADAVLAEFQKAYPQMKPNESVKVDTMMRTNVLRMAGMKSKQQAPVYTYLFAWQLPVLDHFWGAGHSSEIPFVFDNIALAEESTGGGKAAYDLAEKISRAWINFARSGNPNYAGLPAWPTFTQQRGATMIFDNHCEVLVDHDKELMSLVASH